MKMFVVIILLCTSPPSVIYILQTPLYKKPSKQLLITELLRSEKVNKALKHLNKCGAGTAGT